MAMAFAKQRQGDSPSQAESVFIEAFISSEIFQRSVCVFQVHFRGKNQDPESRDRVPKCNEPLAERRGGLLGC